MVKLEKVSKSGRLEPMKYVEQARKILHEVIYATIATVDHEGSPWNTPVFAAVDDRLTVYWCSSPVSQHSQNILANGHAFLVVYNSTVAEGKGVGVYIEAEASQVDDPAEILHALEYLTQRRGKPLAGPDHFAGDGPQRIYKAVPRRVWVNDAEQDAQGNFIRDYRVEIEVKESGD